MFGDLFRLYDAFIAARADEALFVVIFLGSSEWSWFTVGLVTTAIFIPCIRVMRLIPDEHTWQLSILRLGATLVCYGLMVSVLVIGLYAYFANVGGAIAWPANTRERFWPFVDYFGKLTLYGVGAGLVVGVIAWSIIARKIEPLLASRFHQNTKKIECSGSLTDARTISEYLPSLKGRQINHNEYFKNAQNLDSIFLGVDQNDRAVLIPVSKFNKSHVQICGPTNTGKGVQAAIVLVQALMKGDAVFIFDPKWDEWASSVIAQECEKLGIPFLYVNLRLPIPQIHLGKGASANDMFELFVGGFGLDEKGEPADFYRIDDREAAYQLAQAFGKHPELSLPELFDIASDVIDPELYENAKSFISRLKQLVRIKALHTRGGVDLNSVLKQGGAVYVVGAMRGQDIPALQRILALRVIQIIENQPSPDRHAVVFFDEIKYLLSSPTVNAFGTIRDKNANLILAHQSLQDFRDCGKDLSPDAVEGAIRTNTQIKWVYRATDPSTVEWAAKMSGKILVNKERRVVDRNEFLSETTRSERMVDQVERYQFDENTILHLPDGCALCIGAGPAKLALAQPIPTVKRTFEITPAEPIVRIEPGQELVGTACDSARDEDPNAESDELL